MQRLSCYCTMVKRRQKTPNMVALRPTSTYQSKERVGMHVHIFTSNLVLTDGTLGLIPPCSQLENLGIVTRISGTSTPQPLTWV